MRDGRIEAVVGAREVVGADRVIDLGGDLLVPGFIDAQVNGGGGVLFNDDPSVDDHRRDRARAPALRHHGFPAHADQRRSRRGGARHRRGARSHRAPACPACSASTSKGPSSTRSAAACTTPASCASSTAMPVKLLSRPHGGVTMVTLAPERTTPAFIRQLERCRRHRFSAGHTNATYDELQPAFAAGLRGFTHLFNAMSQLGITRTRRRRRGAGARRQLVRPHRRWPPRASRGHEDRAARQAPRPLHAGVGCHAQRRRRGQGFRAQRPAHHREGNKCVDEDGRLAGADLDMASAVRNAVRMLGVSSLTQCAWRAPTRPSSWRCAMSGRIAPGQRANLVRLDDGLPRARNLDRREVRVFPIG